MINKLFRRAACQCSPAAEGGQGVQTPAPRLSSMGGVSTPTFPGVAGELGARLLVSQHPILGNTSQELGLISFLLQKSSERTRSKPCGYHHLKPQAVQSAVPGHIRIIAGGQAWSLK